MSAPAAEWISDRSREDTPPERDLPEGNDGPSHQRTSKKRKVLSCYACRARKMKCDRVLPVCGRCQKTGRRHECTYDPRLLEESNVNVATRADDATSTLLAERPADIDLSSDTCHVLQRKVRAQEERIALLEQQLAQRHTKHKSRYHDVLPEEPIFTEDILFKGKGFKAQFHGVTSVMSIASTYHELHLFTREALNLDHSLVHVGNDFRASRDRRKKSARESNVALYDADANVLAALPEKSVVDTQAAKYFRTCETSYRILHGPSFWEEYQAFWENTCTHKERVSFAVVLVLIISITKCLDQKDNVFVGDTTIDRQTADVLIHTCEIWIKLQPRKQTTLPFLQSACLLLVAKRVNCVGMKQDWINSGDLLRLALASGLHRDPALQGSGRISIFNQQMRKRLWITVVELELQSSVETGLQSGLTALYFDTPAPAHLADEVFSANTKQLPPDQSDEEFTSTSFITASLKSLPLRIHLTHLLNTPSSNIQYADVLHFDAQIHTAVSALPNWNNESAVVPSALLRLQLLQYLLILHRPFAQSASKNNRFMYSFRTCVDVCNSMITIHGDLLSKSISFLSNIRNDVMRVGLTLSQLTFRNCAINPVKSSVAPTGTPNTQSVNPTASLPDITMTKRGALLGDTVYLASLPQNAFLVKTLCTSSLEILERTRQIFEQKVLRLGTGYMEYWILSAAVGILPPPPSPSLSTTHIDNPGDEVVSRCRKAIGYFTALASKVIALQQDRNNDLAASFRTTMSRASRAKDAAHSMHQSGFETDSVSGMNERAFGGSAFTHASGADATDPNSGSSLGDMYSPFDMLQDMQIDGSNWSFPDFWTFDLAAEF
ncbi:hypothetical protein COCC4DRAFT_71435 [Bipolaris maydis ATCC 48331]|uniref:Zn(2)-C6 fungal-type domain-containing protein n=2 Tax=Cochliobolus heterostrophus TaxID=5016 RepID=M2TXE9_COCH5|nr:uncharacterized protein COCC4DRAFT_71435 [Bipolaris maydis ATCC 48331]EMD91194.1 hypothetical protein COCHEDRAFT_1194876 [Bipolaris maydis C5]KAJ5022889.1 hypothetical protein J3E73DRAFT_239221 [Bipolaris maydis]ENI05725.1 hypothetical protein COCC4DRAFT_71435 [Bipolaris maydis ATCC 48331]KAJ5064425.1 C6 zinc finger domain-containing protein [Bipolaris maydis]KAJ6205029.1 C6 zinc finger domain-containing protein [Bipolaris maydis]